MNNDKDFMPANHKMVETWGDFKNLREIGELFKGYFLAQDTKTKMYYIVGGQGKPGDEIFKFKPKELVFDPMRGWTDKQINDCSDKAVLAEFERYFKNITSLESRFMMPMDEAFRFYEDCKVAGYRLSKGRVVMWVMEKIEDLLKGNHG